MYINQVISSAGKSWLFTFLNFQSHHQLKLDFLSSELSYIAISCTCNISTIAYCKKMSTLQ